MSTRYEQAKATLDELITWYEEHRGDGDRNEDTTRLHLVDRLITDVLAWPLEEVRTEKYRDGEYVDYELGRPATRLIVEAKREANHFRLPVGMTSLIHRLSSLTDARPGGKELKEALQQVSGYCATRGVQFAAICNGTQLVAFLGVRTDSTPPLEGSALVFTSLSAMRENFHTLWHNLSRYGVEERNLHVTLREEELPAA